MVRDEKTLIEATQKGDLRAFDSIVELYQDYVYTLCVGVVRQAEIAEEIAQDVFIKVHRHIHKFEGKSSFKTWLYRITLNSALSHKRREKKAYLTDLESVSNDPSWSTSQNQEQRDLGEILEKGLNLLLLEDRIALTLFYFEDMKVAEIAEIMNLSINTVKVKLHRARKRLKEKLVQHRLLE